MSETGPFAGVVDGSMRLPTTPADPMHLAAAVGASGEAVLALDLAGGIRHWNRAATRILGAAVPLTPGTELARAFAEADHVRDLVTRAAAGEVVRQERLLVSTPDGRGGSAVLNLLAHGPPGQIFGLTAVVRDVSEEALAQETLAQAEERIMRAESLARSGTFVIDAHDRSAQWSLGMYLVYGLSPGDVLPSLAAHADLLDESDRPALVRLVSEALYGRTPPALDHRLRRPDGSQGWVHVAVEPMVGPEGSVRGVTGVCQDVTERIQAETMLQDALVMEREAGEELRQADTMRREFLATVSHELRSPLTTLIGLVPFLRSRAPEHAALIEPIERKVAQMTRLIETLLDDARLTAGRVELALSRFPVAPAARELLRERVGGVEGEQWVLHAPEDLTIDMDPEAFSLALGNFIGNAVKYAGDALITVSARDDGDSVTVAVSDLGPGIAPEHQEHLFEAFYRAPGSHQVARGSGFGLSITRRWVELHGGTVACESTLGVGTTFSFTVPVQHRAPEGQ
jgi:PAS domain S-box-containing protein